MQPFVVIAPAPRHHTRHSCLSGGRGNRRVSTVEQVSRAPREGVRDVTRQMAKITPGTARPHPQPRGGAGTEYNRWKRILTVRMNSKFVTIFQFYGEGAMTEHAARKIVNAFIYTQKRAIHLD